MRDTAPWCRWDGEDLIVAVRVRPRARRDAVEGVRAGRLEVRLAAPPAQGAANRALARLLGEAFGVAPTRVALLRGAAAREKLVRVHRPRRFPAPVPPPAEA